MPITTPAKAQEQYRGDREHFAHVLQHLFVPAITRAGYEVVPPIMRGADLIHAEIIKNLETADLVLCDLSLLNANVFFELGIRTALDRPAALVKDDRTPGYPFDTTMINCHSYDSQLAPWLLADQVEALRQHLTDTASRADGRNSLWQYFGLTQRAETPEIENPVERKLDLVLAELATLGRPGGPTQLPIGGDWLSAQEVLSGDQAPHASTALRGALAVATNIAYENHARLRLVEHDSDSAILDPEDFILEADQRSRIVALAQARGVTLEIR